MNADRANLALTAVIACTLAGFLGGRSWGQKGWGLKIGAVLLAVGGLFAFFCAAYTE